jgi:hypothetical protein
MSGLRQLQLLNASFRQELLPKEEQFASKSTPCKLDIDSGIVF